MHRGIRGRIAQGRTAGGFKSRRMTTEGSFLLACLVSGGFSAVGRGCPA